jgi:hypothetical protein
MPRTLSSQRRRFNPSFSSNDDEESDKSDGENKNVNKLKSKKNAGEEYKNVIKSLRNPFQERKFGECDTLREDKKRSAFLAEKEIDPDDWLDDDLGPARKKQKFFTDTTAKTPKEMKFQETLPQKINLILDSDEEGNKLDEYISDYDQVNTLDAFDLMMENVECGGGPSVKRKPRRSSQTKPPNNSPSQSKSQSSLFDAGFSRFIDTANDYATTSSQNSSLNASENTNLGEKQPATIIKVQIEDEKIIVPIYQDVASIKISWLIEEAAKRYYR